MTQGERIRELRKALKLTLDRFGERVGVKKSALSQIENGKSGVTDQMIKSLCHFRQRVFLFLKKHFQ